MEKEIKEIKEEIAKMKAFMASLKIRIFNLEVEMKNISKPITIQSLVIGEEVDINKVAKKLQELSSITQRGNIR